MAIDTRFVTTSDLESLFRSKDTALPLANGRLEFFKDTARNVPKNVYQFSSLSADPYIDIGSVVTLSAIGTPQNNNGDNIVIYYLPLNDTQTERELYFVRVFDQNGNEQFTREAWPNPTSTSSPEPVNSLNTITNQISNPTFSQTFLNTGINIFSFNAAVNKEISIAPDWTLIVSGTGDIQITSESVAGSDNVPTSPPSDLLFTIGSGITSCSLRQRFSKNSGLWTSTNSYPLFLIGSFVARNLNIAPVQITMNYVGSVTKQIVNANPVNTNYDLFKAVSQQIPFSTDPDTNGYVDIVLNFPLNSSFKISSINVFPSTVSPETIIPAFDSTNRNVDYQGNYFIPRLSEQRVPSHLVGWDFTLNPNQFGQIVPLTTNPQYVCDQTIAVKTQAPVINKTINNLLNGIQFDSFGTNSFYIMQYLSAEKAKELVGSNLSVNVFAYKGEGQDEVTMRVYLFAGKTNFDFPILPNSIITLNNDGTYSSINDATFTEIPRSNLPTAKASLDDNTIIELQNQTHADHKFIGWNLSEAQATDMRKFAIVVTFVTPATPCNIVINSISLNSGDIPTRPAPQTQDEVLRECEYYYEKSYLKDVLPGTVTTENSFVRTQTIFPRDANTSTVNRVLVPSTFDLHYNSEKRVIPNLNLYDPVNGAINTVFNAISNDGTPIVPPTIPSDAHRPTSFWTFTTSKKGTWAIRNSMNQLQTIVAPDQGLDGFIQFHYTCDARIGIIN
jgi:hypothetical protein